MDKVKKTLDEGEEGDLDWKRSRNNPAVTKVEECTRLETGVGALIAAGSHELNGVCALLVIEANKMNSDDNAKISLNVK